MLRDWDLQSTLLRRTLQAGAAPCRRRRRRSRSSTATTISTSSSAGSSPAPTASRGGWADRVARADRALRHRRADGEPGSRRSSSASPPPCSPRSARPASMSAGTGSAWSSCSPRRRSKASPPGWRGCACRSGVRQSWWAYLCRSSPRAALVILAYGLVPRPWLGHGAARLRRLSPSSPRSRSRPRAGRSRRAPARRAQGHDLADAALRRLSACGTPASPSCSLMPPPPSSGRSSRSMPRTRRRGQD